MASLEADIVAWLGCDLLETVFGLHYSMRHLMWQAGDTASDTLSCEVDEGTLPSRIQVDVNKGQ